MQLTKCASPKDNDERIGPRNILMIGLSYDEDEQSLKHGDMSSLLSATQQIEQLLTRDNDDEVQL